LTRKLIIVEASALGWEAAASHHDLAGTFKGRNNKLNDMTQGTLASQAGATSTSLWAAIGVLGVVVIALGSALLFVQTHEEELRVANTSDASSSALKSTPPANAAEPIHTAPRVVERKSTAAQTKQAARPVKTAASNGAPPPPAPICNNCGTVTAATPIEREGTASGTGAVAGGVLGAVVGNQVGRGDGKTVATILGAIGGGLAGNAVEKKMKKETVFQIQVRMDDGSTRSFEQAEPLGVGARVRMEGDIPQLLPPN
jgi:outer membrane lipoprotein SlyB